MTAADLMADRVSKKKPSVIDAVEKLWLSVWDNDEAFRKLHDEVSGKRSVIADVFITQKLQDYALKANISEIADASFEEIMSAHKRVALRYPLVSRGKRAALLKIAHQQKAAE